jgi:hypothetical protein
MRYLKRLLSFSLIFAFTCAILIGCSKTVPIENTSSPMPLVGTSTNKAKIADAIVRAGLKTNWRITPAGEGKMIGTLNIRSHTAVVNIIYDETSYRIEYSDSVNLKHTDGRIHKNYNKWVHALDRNINTEIAMLSK